jgi:hypothetical protein
MNWERVEVRRKQQNIPRKEGMVADMVAKLKTARKTPSLCRYWADDEGHQFRPGLKVNAERQAQRTATDSPATVWP